MNKYELIEVLRKQVLLIKRIEDEHTREIQISATLDTIERLEKELKRKEFDVEIEG